MAQCQEIGDLGRKTQIEWQIADILTVVENSHFEYYVSPIFSVLDTSLYLQLHPKSWFYPQCMSLCLISKARPKYPVEYNFGFKKSDGSVLNFGGGVLKEDVTDSGSCKTLKLKDLQKRKSELAPCDVLTVTCTLHSEVTLVNQKKVVRHKTIPLTLIGLDTLSENLKDLFEDKDTCDTTLKVMEKQYKAHRAVLMARSPVFAATFKHETTEKQTGVITIPDCDPGSFQEFLEYLYSGKLKEISYSSAFHLYSTSDKYDIQELKAFCVQCLIECLTIKNMCEIVLLADKYDDTELFSAAQDFFNQNVCEILDTCQWECLLKKNHRLANKLMKGIAQARLKE